MANFSVYASVKLFRKIPFDETRSFRARVSLFDGKLSTGVAEQKRSHVISKRIERSERFNVFVFHEGTSVFDKITKYQYDYQWRIRDFCPRSEPTEYVVTYVVAEKSS